MAESPHAGILNRTEAQGHAVEHFSKQLELLRSLANYGSNLVVRSYHSSTKQLADIVVCGVLLKQVVAMVDASEVLLSNGISHAAHLPARTAFEASVYADFILFSDSERKAMHYMVANYRNERLWAQRATKGSPQAIEFEPVSASIGFDLHASRPSLDSEAQLHLQEVNRILAQPDFRAIDEAFNATRKGKRKGDPEWYSLLGYSSIRKLAESVGRIAEYECFYAKGSSITHSAAYKDHLAFHGKEVRFKPVRHIAEMDAIVKALGTTALTTYRNILRKYRPGEIPALNRQYLREWREPFQNVKAVAYNF
jgi:hypothetical protein